LAPLLRSRRVAHRPSPAGTRVPWTRLLHSDSLASPSVRLLGSARTIPAAPGDREGNSGNAGAGLTVRSVSGRPLRETPTPARAGPDRRATQSRSMLTRAPVR